MSGGPAAALGRFIAAMPKAELHLHLEGAIRPATLLRLAERHRVHLPADGEEGLRRWYRFEDFEHFVEIYVTCSRCLRDPEDFQLVLRELAVELARQQVAYAELHFTISTHLRHGVNGGEVGEALGEALGEAERREGVRLRLIPDIVRNVEPEWADRTLEWALDHRRHGVVALGLSGIESWPAEPFREHFRVAAAEGLHRVAHAGEQCGPESIRETLAACSPERLGHGIRAVDDPALVEELVAHGMPLEVCPTSNLALGNAADLDTHPLGRLLAAGFEVTLGSDDPAMMDTTLTREYERVAGALALEAPALAELSLAAVRHAFLEDSERRRLSEEFRGRFRALGEEHLGAPVEPVAEWRKDAESAPA